MMFAGALVEGIFFVPIFLDRHDLKDITAAEIAEAHRKDLETQDKYGVRFLTYWFDQHRSSGFCLIDAPDEATAMRVHDEAHGHVANQVIPVDLAAVEAFLGRVADPAPSTSNVKPAVDAALRAVLFTDIVDSTPMTARLGDARAVEMIRAHDSVVRRGLSTANGREVKHTGDGIMASFDDALAAAGCARAIQQGFHKFNSVSDEKIRVRIGIDVGEPVADSNDLFGTTVQMAARLCAAAEPEAILVSSAVHEIVQGSFPMAALPPRVLKGFADPVSVYGLEWR